MVGIKENVLNVNQRKLKTVSELIDEPCPKCKEGIIKEIETGIWS